MLLFTSLISGLFDSRIIILFNQCSTFKLEAAKSLLLNLTAPSILEPCGENSSLDFYFSKVDLP